MPDETPTDAYDFGLGLHDPSDGKGLDHSSLQAKPGIDVGPSSGLPDGTSPETYRRMSPDGPTTQVSDPGRIRTTPTNPPHNVTSPSEQMGLPELERSEHSEHYNLGEGDMVTVEDMNVFELDQISDPWMKKTSIKIRDLSDTVRGNL